MKCEDRQSWERNLSCDYIRSYMKWLKCTSSQLIENILFLLKKEKSLITTSIFVWVWSWSGTFRDTWHRDAGLLISSTEGKTNLSPRKYHEFFRNKDMESLQDPALNYEQIHSTLNKYAAFEKRRVAATLGRKHKLSCLSFISIQSSHDFCSYFLWI